MHSLVLFFVIPLLFFLYQCRTDRKLDFKSRLAVLTALPVLYVIGRTLFWSASNSYHSISIRYVLTLLRLLTFTFIVACFFLWVGKRSSNMSKLLVAFGFLSSLLGISTYVLGGIMGSIVNFLPNLLVGTFGRSDWSSRHLTLLPLGASLILVGILGFVSRRSSRLKKTLFGFLLSVCVVINIGFGFEYVVDYAKQQAVVEKLERSGEDDGVNEYMFADQTNFFNARGRLYRARDWWGLVWSAYGLSAAERAEILPSCEGREDGRFVEINGPDTHWQALKNWVSDRDMGFEVTIDDSLGACKPELMQIERFSGVIPILFYFTGAKN